MNQSDRLVPPQQFEAIGRLANDFVHDFNNLLMVISASAEFLEESTPASDPRRADIVQIHEAALRAAELTRHLLVHAQSEVL